MSRRRKRTGSNCRPAVSEKIAHALESPRPRPRYSVTTPTYIAGIGRRLLPTRALDWFARRA